MNENILKALVVISLILSITAVALEVRDEFSLIEPSKIKGPLDPSKIEGTAWTSSNDGSGSGLDSDMLDGTDSSQFLRNDISGTIKGDLYVNGSITHPPQYRYLTIPAASFLPISQDTKYGHFGTFLYTNSPFQTQHIFYAPIQLPDGAKITKLRVAYTKDDPLASLNLQLREHTYEPNLYSGQYELYTVDLPMIADFGTQPFESENLSIDVSNYASAYTIYINMMANDEVGDVIFNWVTIEYVVTNSLP